MFLPSGITGGTAAIVTPVTTLATFARGLGESWNQRPWAPTPSLPSLHGGSSALPGPKLVEEEGYGVQQALGLVRLVMGKWRPVSHALSGVG